jgi:hypothetical protein
MRDLVRKHSRKLRLVLGGIKGATVHPYRTARQRKRIDVALVGDIKRVWILRSIGARRETPADAAEIICHDAVAQLRHLPSHVLLRLPADCDFVIDRDEA